MPLRCITPDGRIHSALKANAKDWDRLTTYGTKLRAPCCQGPVFAAVTENKSRYFRHASMTKCVHSYEPPPVVDIKYMIGGRLRAAGWHIKSEQQGKSPEGHPWHASILAEKAGKVIAFCVIPNELKCHDLPRANRALTQAGISPFWLFEGGNFPVTKHLPAALFTVQAGHVSVHLPFQGQPAPGYANLASGDRKWHRPIGLDEIVDAVAEARLWHGVVRAGTDIGVRMDGAFTKCTACGSWSNMLARVELIAAGMSESAGVYRVSDLPVSLARYIIPKQLDRLGVPPLVRTFDPQAQHHVMANTCKACHALLHFSDHPGLEDRAKGLTQTRVQVTTDFERILQSTPAARWRIAPPDESGI